MIITLRFFSVVSISLGVLFSVYMLTRGLKTFAFEPSYFLYYLPQTVVILVAGVAGWAVFGALAKILGRLDALEQPSVSS